MTEIEASFDNLVNLPEYQPTGADLKTESDYSFDSGLFLNSLHNGTTKLADKDICRFRLTRLFVEEQRVRIGGRTRKGRVTWRRDRHIRDGERFWDENDMPRAVLASHSMINTLDGLEDGPPEGDPTALVDEYSINRDSKFTPVNRPSWSTFSLPRSAISVLESYSSKHFYSGA